VAGNPIKYSRVSPEDELPREPAPSVGQHTREVLIELLGYSDEAADDYLKEFS